MKKVFLLMLILFSVTLKPAAQKTDYPKGLAVVFSFPERKIVDTNAVLIKVTYKNNQPRTLFVLDSLVDGGWQDPYACMYIEIQRFVDGNYKKIAGRSYDYVYGDSVPPVNYHALPSGQTFEMTFNLFDKKVYFEKGKYRLKIYLLKVPLAKEKPHIMEYLISRWFYFDVPEELFRNRKNS